MLTRKQEKARRQREAALAKNTAKPRVCYSDKCKRQAEEHRESERGPFVMRTNNLMTRYRRQVAYGEDGRFWVWADRLPLGPRRYGEWRTDLGCGYKDLNRQVRRGPLNGQTYSN